MGFSGPSIFTWPDISSLIRSVAHSSHFATFCITSFSAAIMHVFQQVTKLDLLSLPSCLAGSEYSFARCRIFPGPSVVTSLRYFPINAPSTVWPRTELTVLQIRELTGKLLVALRTARISRPASQTPRTLKRTQTQSSSGCMLHGAMVIV